MAGCSTPAPVAPAATPTAAAAADPAPKEINLGAAVTAIGPPWIQLLGKDGVYWLTAPGWHPAVKFPGAAEMNAAHQAKYGGPVPAATGPAHAVIQVVADALSRAKSTDREKIREALAKTDMMTIEGPVKFNPEGTSNMITVID